MVNKKVKRISLNIPEDVYADLAALSNSYDLDVNQTISDILSVISRRITGTSMQSWGTWYKVPIKPVWLLEEWLDESYVSHSLFYGILKHFGVEGLFRLDDLDYSLDSGVEWIRPVYSALENSGLYVEDFDVQIESDTSNLTTHMHIEVEKASKKALEKLEEIVSSIQSGEYSKLPRELDDLEFEIEIDKEDEDFWDIKFDCYSSWDEAPNICAISRLIKQILKRAGIEI